MGSGYVVVDVKSDAALVWKTLLSFERYVARSFGRVLAVVEAAALTQQPDP